MFISPSVFSPSCAVWASLFPSLRLCATLSIIAIGQLLSKHCNLAAGCYSARTSNIPNLLMSGTRLPVVSAPAARKHGCLLARLPAFIPYAKVKKLILTHYILFIWKDRCMFFSDAAVPFSRCCFYLFPMDLPGISSASASRPAASSRWLSALALPPAVASRCCRIVPRGASPAGRQPLTHRFPLQRPCQSAAPPQRLCQQQASSGGEDLRFG